MNYVLRKHNCPNATSLTEAKDSVKLICSFMLHKFESRKKLVITYNVVLNTSTQFRAKMPKYEVFMPGSSWCFFGGVKLMITGGIYLKNSHRGRSVAKNYSSNRALQLATFSKSVEYLPDLNCVRAQHL